MPPLSEQEKQELINEITKKCIEILRREWKMPTTSTISSEQVKNYYEIKDSDGNIKGICFGGNL